MEAKPIRKSRAVKSVIVGPPDANNLGTMFGGYAMALIDEIAGLSAMRHARSAVTTASTDSVDFLHPIKIGHTICLESFVTWTHNTSMEVFVKIVGENMLTGERTVCATAFQTFVALDEEGKQKKIPAVIPETDYEKKLHETAPERAKQRLERRCSSKKFANEFGLISLLDI
ncbi:MAG: acyl-CoA thioesterase [Spirochaetales bacterium]|nr:acyl-CoA thioesterase [Spirochaetales bacterium]